MTEKWVEFVEMGTVVLAFLASVVAAVRLRRNAQKHEHSVEDLEKKIKQAIN